MRKQNPTKTTATRKTFLHYRIIKTNQQLQPGTTAGQPTGLPTRHITVWNYGELRVACVTNSPLPSLDRGYYGNMVKDKSVKRHYVNVYKYEI